jgi:predicted MFS family arabinose efflux permease
MANTAVQLWVEPEVRGRIMGLYLVVFMGGTPIGAPIVGANTNHHGARAGMAVCGAVPALVAAALVAVVYRRPAMRGIARPAGG